MNHDLKQKFEKYPYCSQAEGEFASIIHSFINFTYILWLVNDKMDLSSSPPINPNFQAS